MGRRMMRYERKLGLRGSRLARRHAPAWLIRRLLHTPEVPQIRADPALLEEVTVFLREDVQRLSAITGLRFDTWPILANAREGSAEPTSVR
jgi:hypothetical protein